MSEPSASPPPKPEPDQFVIETIEGLKALADQLRLRILMTAAEASCTVKELAKKLGVPQTRLYYHVGMLEKTGLLRVASRRMVSGIEERRYEATAKNWTIAPELASEISSSGMLKAAFDMSRAELEHVFDANPGTDVGTPDSPVPLLTFTRFELDRGEMAEFLTRFTELLSDFAVEEWTANPAPGKKIYNAIFATYVMPSGANDAP